jgi:hypothetical protein
MIEGWFRGYLIVYGDESVGSKSTVREFLINQADNACLREDEIRRMFFGEDLELLLFDYR